MVLLQPRATTLTQHRVQQCMYRSREINWDYANFDLENQENFWRDPDDFRILKEIGNGKFGTVFEGVDCRPPGAAPGKGRRVVLKRLAAGAREDRLRREVRTLQALDRTPGVLRLHGAFRDPRHGGAPTLVTEYLGPDARWFCHGAADAAGAPLADVDVRLYLYQLLRALLRCHEAGVVHRDVKPRNALVCPARKKLTLIDFGLAEFYLPNQRYSCRVASRHYKGPELLVGYGWYDYSLDLWAAGCLMAGLVFRREPFFRGTDDATQLAAIARVLGTDELLDYLQTYDVRLVKETKEALVALGHVPPVDWRRYREQRVAEERAAARHWAAAAAGGGQGPPGGAAAAAAKGGGPPPPPGSSAADLSPPEALDLLGGLLRVDPRRRPTARQALAHPYFDPVRPYFRAREQMKKNKTSNNGRNAHASGNIKGGSSATPADTFTTTAAYLNQFHQQ
eukprot:CAMPEP_0194574544 /NCGR_PEP_ID=MMETSP0292-20121207/10353_1 /TAXON_ID=39354 /ORGANISM="Heterosigma akashiwo, Strain CCMP2393" /LENGTH=451 /DNA_ID=CAMNT_0039426087 /DNA_START=378 /DNA_END=1734 /DNA_ORIENTATION=-